MINGETFLPVFLCLLSMSNNKRKSKKKNGAPQNWFFSASMSLHLFEWLHIPRNEKKEAKGSRTHKTRLDGAFIFDLNSYRFHPIFFR